jgi:hypothetical protein
MKQSACVQTVPSEGDEALGETDIGFLPVNVNLGMKGQNLEPLCCLITQRGIKNKETGQRRGRVE